MNLIYSITCSCMAMIMIKTKHSAFRLCPALTASYIHLCLEFKIQINPENQNASNRGNKNPIMETQLAGACHLLMFRNSSEITEFTILVH